MQERSQKELRLVVARYNAAIGRYVIEAEGDRCSLTFTHPFAAARTGVIIAGELGSTTKEVATSTPASTV